MAKTMSQSTASTEEYDSQCKSEDQASESLCVVPTRPKLSTPISILIESLIKHLCSIYEDDPKETLKKYKLICDKLFNMNMIDESYKMDEFEGIRSQFQCALLNIVTSTIGKDQPLSLKSVLPKSDITNSHYNGEFEEIKYIAGGGFGKVFLVRHKLDGSEYAVKKIPLRCEGIESVRTYLSEVKTFASLNHSNIVQYKAAWLEIEGTSNNVLPSNTITSKIKHLDEEYIYKKEFHSFSNNNHLQNESDLEVYFENSVHSISNCRLSQRSRSKSKSTSDINFIVKFNPNEVQGLKAKPKVPKTLKWATLYIQMSLCQSTLKQWLEKRYEIEKKSPNALALLNFETKRSNTIFEILTQILKGLEYIHSKNIVHHDIKPSNIFIQLDNSNLCIQLGDFGLACPLQSVKHSLAFGTKLYAAPEQLQGQCEKKSDLYSLGIVLLELVENFGTDMERVQNITKLRKGIISENISKKFPNLSQIISKLTVNIVDERPSSTEVLQSIVKSAESAQIEELKQKLAEKEEEILHLKELLRTHGIKGI